MSSNQRHLQYSAAASTSTVHLVTVITRATVNIQYALQVEDQVHLFYETISTYVFSLIVFVLVSPVIYVLSLLTISFLSPRVKN
jgi:hypothetical protein